MSPGQSLSILRCVHVFVCDIASLCCACTYAFIAEKHVLMCLLLACRTRGSQVPGSACYQEMGMGTIRHGDVLFAIDGTRVYRAELKLVCVWECVRVILYSATPSRALICFLCSFW